MASTIRNADYAAQRLEDKTAEYTARLTQMQERIDALTAERDQLRERLALAVEFELDREIVISRLPPGWVVASDDGWLFRARGEWVPEESPGCYFPDADAAFAALAACRAREQGNGS